MTELAWFVIEARDGRVRDVYLALALRFAELPNKAGFEVWCPFDRQRAANRARSTASRTDRWIPRFGRFLFARCRMTPGLHHALIAQANVIRVLCEAGSDTPAAQPNAHIEWLRDNPPVVRGAPLLDVGDMVRITEGPFAQFEGPVQGIDKRGVLRVMLTLFGRPSPLIIEAGHVQRVQQAKPRILPAEAGRSEPLRRPHLRKHGRKAA